MLSKTMLEALNKQVQMEAESSQDYLAMASWAEIQPGLHGVTQFFYKQSDEERMHTLRLIHYSSWLAQRWDDPAFPHAFPFFNTQRYWQDRILELREQIAAMDEGPLQLIA